MPIRLAAHKKFQWAEDNGLPVGHVATFGGVAYLLCCPLCSSMHELPGQTFDAVGQGHVVKPRCLLREFAGQKRAYGQTAPWQTIYRDWLKAHPKAAEFTEVQAIFIGKGSELPAAYEGVIPHKPAPAVSIVRVKEQDRQAKQMAKDQRRRSKQHTKKPAA